MSVTWKLGFFPDSPVSVFPVIPGKSLVESLQFVRLQVKFVPGNSLNFHNGNMSCHVETRISFLGFPVPVFTGILGETLYTTSSLPLN
jgi:hypothetical protein